MLRPWWGRFIILTGSAVAVLVWQSVQATRIGYNVERSRRRVAQLKSQIATLQVEWEKRVAPAQLSHQALTKFGMRHADPRSIRVLETSPASGGSS